MLVFVGISIKTARVHLRNIRAFPQSLVFYFLNKHLYSVTTVLFEHHPSHSCHLGLQDNMNVANFYFILERVLPVI